MSLPRHATGWAALVAGAACTNALPWPDARLQALADAWQVELAAWMGMERAAWLAASGDIAQPGALLVLRAATLGAWLWLLLPLWLAAAVQGEALGWQRRHSFGAANPSWHVLSGHAVVALCGLLLAWLALPVPVPVAAIPVGGLLLAIPIALRTMHRPAWRR